MSVDKFQISKHVPDPSLGDIFVIQLTHCPPFLVAAQSTLLPTHPTYQQK
jgi:hypothetical protein